MLTVKYYAIQVLIKYAPTQEKKNPNPNQIAFATKWLTCTQQLETVKIFYSSIVITNQV